MPRTVRIHLERVPRSNGPRWSQHKAATRAERRGDTESERFDSAVRKMFTVPKTVVVKQESRQLATNRRKRAKA